MMNMLHALHVFIKIYVSIQEIVKDTGHGQKLKRNIHMKGYASRFYKSLKWQNMRDNIIKRDKGLCVDCLKNGMITTAEEVHHIIPITESNINDPSITLNPDNLVSLCRECHKARHNNKSSKRFFVDEFGRVSSK